MSTITSTLGGLCTPAQLYLALSVIALIFVVAHSFSIATIIIKVIFIGLWTFVLNWICSKGYTNISWVLVLLPYITFLLMFLLALDASSKNAKQHSEECETHENVGPTTLVPSTQPMVSVQQPISLSSASSMNAATL